MVTIVNSFIIPDDLVKKMKGKIEETKEKKIELGFGLCRIGKSDIIRPGGDCTGTKCKIERPSQCREKEDEYQGLYHTHPIGTTKPSVADLYGMYRDGLGCIGSIKEDKIKCFVRKDPNIDIDTLGRLQRAYFFMERLQSELPKEDFEKLHDAAIKQLTNENFKVVDVK